MSSAISMPLHLVQHNTAIRNVTILIVLLAAMYLAVNAIFGSNVQSRGLENGRAVTLENSIQAPNEALIKSQNDINTAAGNSASTNIQSVQTTTSSEPGDSNVETKVSVNGKQIKLDNNSSVHKVIRSNGQKTTVDISTQSNSISNNHSSLNLSIESSSETAND